MLQMPKTRACRGEMMEKIDIVRKINANILYASFNYDSLGVRLFSIPNK